MGDGLMHRNPASRFRRPSVRGQITRPESLRAECTVLHATPSDPSRNIAFNETVRGDEVKKWKSGKVEEVEK
jgi:hypothetical protein